MWLVHGQPIGLAGPTLEHGMAFIHPSDRDRVQSAIQEALAGKGEYETEYRTTFPDGSVHWIGARGRAIFDEAGRPERMIGVAMDITSNKLAEDALRHRCAVGHIADPKDPKRQRVAFVTQLSHGIKAAGSTHAMSAPRLSIGR